jgi:hypothetical protein
VFAEAGVVLAIFALARLIALVMPILARSAGDAALRSRPRKPTARASSCVRKSISFESSPRVRGRSSFVLRRALRGGRRAACVGGLRLGVEQLAGITASESALGVSFIS